MRKLNEIIVHCTGTIPSESTTVEAVRKYHMEHNGWKDIGYHYLIYLDGSIHAGRPIDQKGAHCKNHNEGTVGHRFRSRRAFATAGRDFPTRLAVSSWVSP